MASVQDFIPQAYTGTAGSGSFSWSAPSNIALVKYWGKKANQIPANPSISPVSYTHLTLPTKA